MSLIYPDNSFLMPYKGLCWHKLLIKLTLNFSFFVGFGDSEHTFDESMPASVKAVTSVSSLFEEAVTGEYCIQFPFYLTPF